MNIPLDFPRAHAAGFNIIDCEIRSRSILYLLLRRDYTQDPTWHDGKEPPPEGRLQKRLLALQIDNPVDRMWGVMRLDGLMRSQCAMAFTPETGLVVVDSDSRAWSKSSVGTGFEPPMPSLYEGGPLRGGIMRTRCFGGALLAASNGRDLFQRTGVAKWERIGPAVPYVFEPSTAGDFGFEDFDRFNQNAWYAGGGLSDLWRFDGEQWRQCAFPSNQGIFAVCCAGDGEVYLSVGAGSIWRGQGDRWTLLHEGADAIPIKDLVWYEDKVWATSDYGLWTIEGGVFAEAQVPSSVKICAGNLATRDGVLLVAGYGGAAFKRGGQWQVIFRDHDLRQPTP